MYVEIVQGADLSKILYINSDGASAGSRLADSLDRDEFAVEVLARRSEATKALDQLEPDLVLVACAAPDGATLRFCAGLRTVSSVPVVVCSPSAREADIVRVFEAGADDYLVTPMRSVELTARLRAVLRRTAESPKKQQQGDLLVAGPIEIRLKERKVLRHGSPVDLSPIEFRLLTTLVHDIGRAVSHSKLMAHVWGPEYVDCRHYLRLYIKYLRTKIEDDPRNPKLILSEWGVGYRFEPVAA